MAESSCIVSLPQMIDLALNCPEPGAVNFKILHSLLHVIVQQIDLLACNVEVRGDSGEKMQNLLTTNKIAPSIMLTEYVVTPGNEKKAKKKKTKKRVSAESVGEEPAKRTSSSSLQTIVVVEQADEGVSTPQVSVAVPKSTIENLQKDIKDMKCQIQELVDLPANTGLLQAIRSMEEDKTPILDMFQILSLTKRIDGAEAGMAKLASMMEDLARNTPAGEKTDVGGEKFENMLERLHVIEMFLGISEDEDPVLKSGGLTAVRDDMALMKQAFGDFEMLMQYYPIENLLEALRDLDDLRSKLLKRSETDEEDTSNLPPELRLNEMDNKLNELNERITTLDLLFKNEIDTLETHLGDLECEMGKIVERINTGMAGDGGGTGGQNVAELYSRLMSLQSDLETIQEASQKLVDEKEERQQQMDLLREQLEILKTIKADKEDLREALADKADACAVNRKVSHDEFDTACEDLSKGIEDALTKLTQQEALWQETLESIQSEIGTKLDKMELTPLRDFVTNKLKMLQEKMRALAAMKKDTEAAGTKSKLLRNVNCISCDKDVVMKTEMDPSMMPQPVALPPNRSMGPYLAYELDALRKQQKCVPGSRNLHHFENAITGAKSGKDEDHICNRYCGGSHTTTTPQQRVTRLGHFLNQWGAESETEEGFVKGTDGQMYKARSTPRRASAGPGPTRPVAVNNIVFDRKKEDKEKKNDLLEKRMDGGQGAASEAKVEGT